MNIDLDKMVEELERDEDIVPYAYQDQFGFWTIGVGRLIDKRKNGRLTTDEIAFLHSNDIKEKYEDIQNEPWFIACDTDNRRRALINMCFQLGHEGIRSFKTSLGFIAEQRWNDAADNLAKSLWAKQTPERASRVIGMIRNG